MFAYCGNKPSSRSDYSGEIWLSESPEAITIRINTLFDKYDEIINGQNTADFSNIPFGNSTVGQSGCGAIAVHNALLLSGRDSNLLNVLDFFSSYCSFRTFGVMPCEIGWYLTYLGVSYIASADPSIIEYIKDGGVLIITYWNKTYSGCINLFGLFVLKYSIPNIFEGAHTVAVTYSDGKYDVYNARGDLCSVYSFDDIFTFIGEGFIYGYYIR